MNETERDREQLRVEEYDDLKEKIRILNESEYHLSYRHLPHSEAYFTVRGLEGSYEVEGLTQKVYDHIWKLIEKLKDKQLKI